MAKKQDYMPHTKAELDNWATKFYGKVEANVNHYGINQEQIKTLEIDTTAFSADLKAEELLIDQKQTQVKKTQADRDKLVDYCRTLAQMIKASPDYTDEVGREFDIIGAENPFDPNTFKPVLTLRRVSNGVEISFTKSLTDGVNIYRRLDKTTDDWQFLARDTKSPYIDTHGMDNHATYQYMAWAVISDEQIGLQSAVQIITV